MSDINITEVPIHVKNDTLATEMLKEIKATSRRWFIAFCVMVGLELITIVGFILYLYYTLPTEETSYEQTVEDIDSSDIKQIIGGDTDGQIETESDAQEERSTQD